mgnify:CR=1 FL=1
MNIFTVYVLRDKNGNLYKGVTGNLERRLQEHRRKRTITTRKMIDVKIVYTETFSTFAVARAREVYFKTAAGRRFLKTKIDSSIGTRPND